MPQVERQGTWQEHHTFTWSTRVSRAYEASYQNVTLPWVTGPWRAEGQGDQRPFAWLRPLHQLTQSHVSQTDTWEMAPYPGDSAAPGRVLVRYVGESEIVRQESGESSIVFGPWEVTIRGLTHGTQERRVLGSWPVALGAAEHDGARSMGRGGRTCLVRRDHAHRSRVWSLGEPVLARAGRERALDVGVARNSCGSE